MKGVCRNPTQEPCIAFMPQNVDIVTLNESGDTSTSLFGGHRSEMMPTSGTANHQDTIRYLVTNRTEKRKEDSQHPHAHCHTNANLFWRLHLQVDDKTPRKESQNNIGRTRVGFYSCLKLAHKSRFSAPRHQGMPPWRETPTGRRDSNAGVDTKGPASPRNKWVPCFLDW